MFGKKKAPLPEGIRLMHYEGLPSFAQDAPCFMEQTAEALVFRRVEGPSVTLPLAKVDSLDIMDERNFAAKYRGTSPNTSRTNAVKWYAVFTYGDKHVAVWFLGGKESKELYALKKQTAQARTSPYKAKKPERFDPLRLSSYSAVSCSAASSSGGVPEVLLKIRFFNFTNTSLA